MLFLTLLIPPPVHQPINCTLLPSGPLLPLFTSTQPLPLCGPLLHLPYPEDSFIYSHLPPSPITSQCRSLLSPISPPYDFNKQSIPGSHGSTFTLDFRRWRYRDGLWCWYNLKNWYHIDNSEGPDALMHHNVMNWLFTPKLFNVFHMFNNWTKPEELINPLSIEHCFWTLSKITTFHLPDACYRLGIIESYFWTGFFTFIPFISSHALANLILSTGSLKVIQQKG